MWLASEPSSLLSWPETMREKPRVTTKKDLAAFFTWVPGSSSIRCDPDLRKRRARCYSCLYPMSKFAGPTLGALRRARSFLVLLCLTGVFAALGGCGDTNNSKQEYAYVASPEAELQDRVASFHSKTGTVRNGDKVRILEHMTNRHYVRVKAPSGEEGWIQERNLASQQTFDEFQRLAEHFKDAPGQATAMTTQEVNLHAVPGRKTEHLYQLSKNEKVDLLQRQAVDRNALPEPSSKKEPESDASSGGESAGSKTGQPPVLEDWWLIRDSQKRIGWAYSRLLYLDIPIDVAQYAEGQRIVAFFVIDQVQDEDKKVPEYLVFLTENKDGLPYDYDQVRLFT